MAKVNTENVGSYGCSTSDAQKGFKPMGKPMMDASQPKVEKKANDKVSSSVANTGDVRKG